MPQKIIFAGTPDFAAASLKALLDAGIRPCAVYTQPDRAARRGHKLTPTPVKELALAGGLEVRTPENFKDQKDVDEFKALGADLCIVAAYGVILPDAVLEAPRCGCVNIHGSLLPRYRGAAPIQRALLEGCESTGVTLIRLERELDAGAMYASAQIPIEDSDTSGTLFEKLASLGASLLMKNLGPILAGTLRPVPQDPSKATYAKKLTKDMAPLDFERPARELWLQVRALNPWPVATARLGGTVYKIFEASPVDSGSHDDPGAVLSLGAGGVEVACSEGSLLLKVIQAPGKGRVNAGDMARSNPQKFRGAHFG
ncbi:MAG: methionyl-tRNA formyltransferase [Succinivibrio sp.]